MSQQHQPGQHALTAVAGGTATVLLVVAMVRHPEAAFDAAVAGLEIWWHVVFPALLPFFIGAQLLMGLGVVHAMGVLLEPLMRPWFRVPGEGSFVMAMGLASGYPIGAVLTGDLRRNDRITQVEAERLISFTNTADPIFMAGAVAVGMFGRPELAGLIMVAHYLGALTTGLLYRFYRPQAPATPARPVDDGHLIARMARALVAGRREDGRPFGRLLGDCVERSANILVVVGGFIILFSVVIGILTEVGVVGLVSAGMTLVLAQAGLDAALTPALVSGLFEISLGTELASRAQAPLAHSVMIAGAIIAWSGFSVHAQVAAMIQGTDIRMGPYLASRLLHAVLVCLYTLVLLMTPFYGIFEAAAGRVVAAIPAMAAGPAAEPLNLWSEHVWFAAWAFVAALACLTLLGAGARLTRRLSRLRRRG